MHLQSTLLPQTLNLSRIGMFQDCLGTFMPLENLSEQGTNTCFLT